MSVNPRDFLASARRQAAGESEIDQRGAGSRAWFAAFHACRLLVEGLNLVSPTAGEREGHSKRLIRALQQAEISGTGAAAGLPDHQARRLGQALRSLRDLRNNADYRIGRAFSPNQAQQMIRLSAVVINEAESLLWERLGGRAGEALGKRP